MVGITIAMLAVYIVVMLGIGIYTSRKTKSVSDFVLGGRGVGSWLTAFAYGTSYFSAVVFIGYAGQFESRFRLFWYCNMPFAVFASAKPHGTRAFARLFVHAGVRFPRPFAGAIGTLFENAKLIFPPGAVETASAAIFIISGTTGLIAVKSRLLLHEQFKRPLLALCEIHSGCTSFPAGIKKRRYFLPQRG